MTITTTLGALAAGDQALARLAALRLPVKAAYHIAKLTRLVAEEVAHFHAERMALIRELGVTRAPTPEEQARGQAGAVVQVAPEHVETFQARIQELAAIEVTIAWGPISLALLDGQSIAPADLMALGNLIVETTD